MSYGMDEHLVVTPRGAGNDDVEESWSSLRPLGWASILCAVLWLGGFGSFVAIGLGLTGILGRHKVTSDGSPPPGLRLCQIGTAVGAVGLAVTATWLLAG